MRKCQDPERLLSTTPDTHDWQRLRRWQGPSLWPPRGRPARGGDPVRRLGGRITAGSPRRFNQPVRGACRGPRWRANTQSIDMCSDLDTKSSPDTSVLGGRDRWSDPDRRPHGCRRTPRGAAGTAVVLVGRRALCVAVLAVLAGPARVYPHAVLPDPGGATIAPGIRPQIRGQHQLVIRHPATEPGDSAFLRPGAAQGAR
jgi:hypothetical protein